MRVEEVREFGSAVAPRKSPFRGVDPTVEFRAVCRLADFADRFPQPTGMPS